MAPRHRPDVGHDPAVLDDEAFDPERLRACEYWRCGELYEARTANQRYCRKACRSRQAKWERAQARRARRANPPRQSQATGSR